MSKYVKKIVSAAIIVSFILTNINAHAYQDMLRQAATRITPAAAESLTYDMASPGRASSAGISAFIENDQRGVISFNIPDTAGEGLIAWNNRFKESQVLLYEMFGTAPPQAINIAAFILAVEGSDNTKALIVELEQAFDIIIHKPDSADTLDYLIHAMNAIQAGLLRSSIFYPVYNDMLESAEVMIKLHRMQNTPIPISDDFARPVGAEERASVEINHAHPQFSEELVNVSDLGIIHDKNRSYIRRAVAEQLQKLNRTLQLVGWHIQIRDSFRTIRSQKENIKNYFLTHIKNNYAGLFSESEKEKKDFVEFLASMDDYLRVELRGEINRLTSGIAEKGIRIQKTADLVYGSIGKEIKQSLNQLAQSAQIDNIAEDFSNKLATAFFHFADPEPLAPHVSGGAFDLEIINEATGKIIPVKEWQVICDGKELPNASDEDKELFKFVKEHPGYKEYEEKALIGNIDPRLMDSLRNRRIFYHMFTGLYGLFPEGLCEPNRGEFWHFDIGNSAHAYHSGKPAYYWMAVKPNVAAELMDLDPGNPDLAVETALAIDAVDITEAQLAVYSDQAIQEINDLIKKLNLSNRLFAAAIEQKKEELVPFVQRLLYYKDPSTVKSSSSGTARYPALYADQARLIEASVYIIMHNNAGRSVGRAVDKLTREDAPIIFHNMAEIALSAIDGYEDALLKRDLQGNADPLINDPLKKAAGLLAQAMRKSDTAFGHKLFGDKSLSEQYFKKNPDELKPDDIIDALTSAPIRAALKDIIKRKGVKAFNRNPDLTRDLFNGAKAEEHIKSAA
jgi:hypothetical protein